MLRVVLFVTATVGWVVLVYLASLVIKLSSWVVYHDPVWAQMDTDGLKREHMIFETLHAAKEIPFTGLITILGVIFLALLFHTFFSGKPREAAPV